MTAASAAVCILTAAVLGGCAYSKTIPPAELQSASLTRMRDSLIGLDGYVFQGGDRCPGYPSCDAYRRQIGARVAAQRTDWPDRVRAAIAAGEIFTGMTREQVFWSWGPPRVEKVENSAAGQTIRWYYGGAYTGGTGTATTFRGDVLTWWHDTGQ